MASILDRYRDEKDKDGENRSSVLDRYREKPVDPNVALSSKLRSSSIMEPIDFQSAVDRLPKSEKVDSVIKGTREQPVLRGALPTDVPLTEKQQKEAKKQLNKELRKGINVSIGDRVLNRASEFLVQGINNAALEIPLTLAGGDQRADYEKTGFTTAGKLAGELVPISRAYKITKGLTKAAIKGLSKTGMTEAAEQFGRTQGIAGGSKALEALARGEIAGTAYSTTKELADVAFDTRGDSSQSLGERAKNIAIEGAMFGAGDAVLSPLGPVVRKAYQSFVTRNKAPENETIVGLLNPKKLKVADADTTLNNVMGRIKPMVTERMTPPLENPNELAKWVKNYLGGDISLNEVRKLPYEDLRQMAEEMRNTISVSDEAIKAAGELGYDLPALLDGEILTVADRVGQDAQKRVYGIYPDTMPNVKKPRFEPVISKQPNVPNKNVQSNGLSKQEQKYVDAEKAYNDFMDSMDTKYGDATTADWTPGENRLWSDLQSNKVAAQMEQVPIRALDDMDNLGDIPFIFPKDHPYSNKPKVTPLQSKATNTGGSSVKEVSDDLQKTADDFLSFDPSEVKDLKGITGQTRDVYRNLEATLGPNANPYIESLNAAKSENVAMQKYWTKRLKTEVVDKLGIQKGSKLSALVQKYGEKTIDIKQLQEQAPDDWEKVVEADKWFREAYDHMIDIVNDSRAKLYPTNPDKIVPKRKDYYRHFKEQNGLTGIKNLFETPAQISPKLEGLSEFTKPKSKFAGFMQKRGLGEFKNDAVGGFLEYIPAASRSTHIDPQIEVFRSLAKSLSDVTETSKNANNLIRFLEKYANSLAGKSHDFDRAAMDWIPGGRKTMGVIRWINNRVKANTILGNVGSLLAQLGNVPNGIAATKQYAVKGLSETMGNIFGKGTQEIKKSPFLKERYLNTREFDTRWIDQPKKLTAWTIETADRIGTNFIWNSAHAQGIAKKVADPIAYADDLTRKMVAGRGVGEVPLMQESVIFQVLAPFTLEVGNAWRVIGDFVKKKDVGALMTLFVGSYMFNKVMEGTRGSGVVFDPIQAVIEAMEPGLSPMERVGRVAGEVVSNIPLGQQVASAYPEYGTDTLPTREDLFGDNDPTRFGDGLTAVKGIQDPLYKLLPSFGGNQIKKSIQGIKALVNKGHIKNDKLQFPIERTPVESTKAILFGPGGTRAGREYYDNDRRPLSEKQTESYKSLPEDQQQEAYINLLKKRLEDVARKVSTNEDLDEKERKRQIDALQRKMDEIKKQYGEAPQ